MKYSDGAKRFIAGVVGAALICVVILFQCLIGESKGRSQWLSVPDGQIVCNGEIKTVDRQQLIKDLSDMGQEVLCVQRVGEEWKEKGAK